ncbi:MAG: hypothetical protein MET45_08585 [Nostoc sp. LLA-1]|nr:hypothetical protein [Cyanocohniella sp. LLY]
MAKLAQTWSQLWGEWNQIIWQASQEEGKYIVQEERWEEPYFDDCTFVEDLEAVAQKMKPLVKTAFENGFSYDDGFAASLLSAETDIADGIPDWMEIANGIHLEGATTSSLLEWEWLLVQSQGQDGFKLAQKIREWSEEFSHTSLDDDVVIDFFSNLPDVQKKIILDGMTANRESKEWKSELENTYSYWHIIYMELMQQFATPEIYLNNLRATISQQAQLGREYNVIHLLTRDLTQIKCQGNFPYPKFYEVVIQSNQLSTPDEISRRTYLQEYAPPDLWERVIAYWQANLHNFVPLPEASQNSDYTKNAQWMSALKELAPQNYDSLLSQWKVQHKRRSNLWKAMRNLGLT